MNILISLITVHFILTNVRKNHWIPFKKELLLQLGVITPAGDHILRAILGEIWFQTSGLIFHSYFYNGLFWGAVALMHWVYRRNIRQAVEWFMPLAGLSIYAVLTIISAETAPFFSPWSHRGICLNWVGSGYVVPIILIALLLIINKWRRLSKVIVSRISLGILLVYIISLGLIQLNIILTLPDDFAGKQPVNIAPSGILPYKWNVVTYKNNQYFLGHYLLIKGFQSEVNAKDAFHDFEISQIALTYPEIFRIYRSTFKNPVISATIQNETILIEISELIPYAHILSVDNLKLVVSKNGQILDYDVDYGAVRL